MEHLDAQQTYALAVRNGITLSVPKDEDVIRAKACWGVDYQKAMTDELRSNITANKDALIRFLLLKQAFTYLSEHNVRGANAGVLEEPGKRVDELSSPDHPMSEYREAIREYVRAGLREFRRVREAA